MHSEIFITQNQLVSLAGIFLFLFAIIGAFDGIYFHLIKYKLHLSPTSRLEHSIHILRAFLFVPVIFFLFGINSGGIYLYTGIAFALLDLIAEGFDVLVEKQSREALGGISGAEQLCHIAATTFRILAIAFILVAKIPAAFQFAAPLQMPETYPSTLLNFSHLFAATTCIAGIEQILSLIITSPRDKRSALFLFRKLA